MRRSKPPALATWLLEHARFGAAGGVIAGDLLEEFNAGRSALWYWRQVLAAIAVGCTSEVRRHRALAAWAILISGAANCVALIVGHDLMVELFRRRLLPYHPQLAYWALCFFGGLASGLIVALLHRAHRNAMLLTSAAAWPLSLLVGWALTLNAIARTRSLQQPLLQIAGDAIAYYLVALTGFVIGGCLFTPASKPGGPSSGRRSPAY